MRKNDISLVDIPLALVLLTRLPLPRLASRRFQRQAQAVWAFPLAGLATTLPACLAAYAALTLGLSAALAAGLLLMVQVLLTGAMHEDGLADCADGFWGGFAPARRLEIMKDSQIGSYGVLALVFAIGLRWQALSLLLDLGQIWSPLALALLSRAMMPVLMVWLPNARQSGLSQSVGRPSRRAAGLGLGLAVALALPLLGFVSLALAVMLALVTLGLGLVARAKIGGQTGDVLGACQQISEIAGLLILVALLS
ncbi:adenosylcobinamide-GDP ribazoletransferase [Pseudophaeobacter arcticus]|uniref:adenosylcobinamide-GDP ribazoletransferase n=1 Tax=Pseudophaeobacter arcticus TaxID=385492 RepID=UPI003A96D6D3